MSVATHPRSRSLPSLWFLLLVVSSVCLLLVGCGEEASPQASAEASTTPPTATPYLFPTATPIPTATSTSAPTAPPADCLPPSPAGQTANTPIAPQGWTTYQDPILHYSLRYPANWLVPYGGCPGNTLDIYNFDPRDGVGGSVFPQGGIKIEVAPQTNATNLSLKDFVQMTEQTEQAGVGGPACPAFTTQPMQIGGHDAFQVTCPDLPSFGYQDFISDGSLILTMATGGVLSPALRTIFQLMIASMTFTT